MKSPNRDMTRLWKLPTSIIGCVVGVAALMGVDHASAERLLSESFENFTENNKPIGWQSAGHPSYLRVADENSNNWSTPYGEHAMSTYSTGVGTKTVGNVPGVGGDGNYTLKFNVSSSAAIGEYRAEIWVFDAVTGWRRVAETAGDTDGSKDFSFSGQLTWRYNYADWVDPGIGFSTLEGQEIQIKLMQDPNRTNWRHTPVWDNVTFDYIPDIDTRGPELVGFTSDFDAVEAVSTNQVVTYQVAFDEPMNPATVGIDDFANQGSASLTIQSVTPNPDNTVFAVEVIPTGEGNLRLKIQEGAILEDANGNAMNTSGSLIQDDTTFVVEAGIPTILPTDFVDDQGGGPIQAGTLVTYTMTFSKDMDASTFTAVDLGNAGSAPISIGTITEISPGVFTVEVTANDSGTLQLRINPAVDIRAADGANLNTSSAIADDTILIVDSDPPFLVEFQNDSEGNPVVVGTLVTYDVFFSEAMNAATIETSDFGNAITVGAAPFTIESIEQASAEVYRIEIMPTGPGQIQLRINPGAVLEDLTGNALDTAVALLDESTVTVTDSVADPYLAWSEGAAFDADANTDGIPNGIAWLLGAAGPMGDVRGDLPVPSMDENGRLVLAFRCLKPADRGGASLKVQFSGDLGLSATWAANEAEVPDFSSTVGNIVFEVVDEGSLHYVEAKMDVAGSGMFGRLVGTGAVVD